MDFSLRGWVGRCCASSFQGQCKCKGKCKGKGKGKGKGTTRVRGQTDPDLHRTDLQHQPTGR